MTPATLHEDAEAELRGEAQRIALVAQRAPLRVAAKRSPTA